MKLRYEPVLILDAVKYLLATLTALGVVAVDGATASWLIAIVGAVLTLISTVATRSKVTPVAKPPLAR